MPWEYRRRRKYYYAVRRYGSKVIKTYYGSGIPGQLAEQADIEERHDRQRERMWRRDVRHAEQALLDFSDALDVLQRAELVAAGYHQHDRGQWRQKRRSSHVPGTETTSCDTPVQRASRTRCPSRNG